MRKDRITECYRIVAGAGGNRYHFFCEASGALGCTTEPYAGETPAEELRRAWETEGKHAFNQCACCGKWVSDVMFNADVLQCVDCAPWENKPNYCSQCGAKVSLEDVFCRKCGEKLQYREVRDHDSLQY